MRGIYTKTKGNEKMFESEEFELSSSRLIEVQLYFHRVEDYSNGGNCMMVVEKDGTIQVVGLGSGN